VGRELNILLYAGRLPRALRALVMTADIELWVKNSFYRNKVCSKPSLRAKRSLRRVPVIRDGNLPNSTPEVCVKPTGLELHNLTNAGIFPSRPRVRQPVPKLSWSGQAALIQTWIPRNDIVNWILVMKVCLVRHCEGFMKRKRNKTCSNLLAISLKFAKTSGHKLNNLTNTRRLPRLLRSLVMTA